MSPDVARFAVRTSLAIFLLGLPIVAVAYLRFKRAEKMGSFATSLSPEARIRRLRLWIAFWWIWFLSIGSLFALSGFYEMDGQKRKNPDPSWIATLPIFVFLAITSHVICRVAMKQSPARLTALTNAVDADAYRRATSAPPRGSTSAKSQPNQPAPAWLWLMLVVIFASFIFLLRPGKHGVDPQNDGQGRGNGWSCLGAFVAVLAIPCGVYLWAWCSRDRSILRANRRAQEGDIDGAIDELQCEIEMRGPTADRLVALASLFMCKNDYANALGWYRKGLAINPDQVNFRLLLAMCLAKTRHADEAITVFNGIETCPGMLLDPFLVSALELIELGRVDQAETLIDRFDSLVKTQTLDSQESREQYESQIIAARAKIAEARGHKSEFGLPDL